MSRSYTPITHYRSIPFSAVCNGGQTISHDVYRLGSGPPVIIIQELPGIGPQTLQLADELL